MTKASYTAEHYGTICDICYRPLDEANSLSWYRSQGQTLNRFKHFFFKRMDNGVTGKAYDAHSQCAADILSDFIEGKLIRGKS